MAGRCYCRCHSTLPFAKPASVSSHSWHTPSSRDTIQSPVQPCIWLKARGLWGPWCRSLFSSNEALLELVHERLPHELKRQGRCTPRPAPCSRATGENCREPPSWTLVLLPGETVPSAFTLALALLSRSFPLGHLWPHLKWAWQSMPSLGVAHAPSCWWEVGGPKVVL